jgi:hypothetical protein
VDQKEAKLKQGDKEPAWKSGFKELSGWCCVAWEKAASNGLGLVLAGPTQVQGGLG